MTNNDMTDTNTDRDEITEPLGDVDWAEEQYSYVACLYGPEGHSPGDCFVRVGVDAGGLWWIEDGDSVFKELSGPYTDREQAESAAEELADSQNEAEDGDDAEAYLVRCLEARKGEPDEEGEWCVCWDSVGDDSSIVERYAEFDSADAAAELYQRQLQQAHTGRLLCGYEVRRLVGGRWEEVG